ncbi:MAG TPA: cytochrome P450 [Jatrophihabitans sp.]|nr:cytochrome P450 [Jatrophihabitans sp.]
MTTISDADVAYLDVLDPHFRPDGPEVTEARARSWYARTPFGIMVLRHDALSRLLSDRRMRQGSHLILANQGLVDGPVVDWMNSIILSIEGPDHARLRRLVSMAFTPRSVTALRPRMRAIAGELIDRFPPGRVEFMSAFASPYPASVICELLGVPADLRADVHGWADDLGLAFGYTAVAELPRIEAALTALYAATDRLVASRRAAPGADVLSGLVAARDEGGERLSDGELRLLVTGLLFAGQDTTHHQLGQVLDAFLQHPEQWRLLRDRPDLAAAAVDEVIRLHPSTPVTGRLVVEDLEYDGVTIPAGTFVQMALRAGNTDPAVFGPDADRFDITVERPAALTFGAGPHYCLGAALARAEMTEALQILPRRLGAIAPDGAAHWRPALGITGPTALPIRYTGW